MTNRHYYLAAIMAAASITVSARADAKSPTWVINPEGGSANATRVKAGDKVQVKVVVDEQGKFTAPSGWATRFSTTTKDGKPIPCAPDRPPSCGVWIAEANMNADASPTFSYTPSTGSSDNRTFTIAVDQPVVVPPQPAAYPLESGNNLEKRVYRLERTRGWARGITFGAGALVAPELPTTSGTGAGFIAHADANVIDFLKIGLIYTFANTNIPIDPVFSPAQPYDTETRHQLGVNVLGSYQNRWIAFDGGLGLGWQRYSYDTTFVRQLTQANGTPGSAEFVMKRDQDALFIAPMARFIFFFVPNFGAGITAMVPITLPGASRVIGQGSTVQNGVVTQQPQGGETIKANIDLGFSLEFRLPGLWGGGGPERKSRPAAPPQPEPNESESED